MAVVIILVVSGKLLCELLRNTHDCVMALHESGVELSSVLVVKQLPGFPLFFGQLDGFPAVPKRGLDANFPDLLGFHTELKNVAEEGVCHNYGSGWEA